MGQRKRERPTPTSTPKNREKESNERRVGSNGNGSGGGGGEVSLKNLAAVLLLLAVRKNNAFIRSTNGFKNIKEAFHLCIYAS